MEQNDLTQAAVDSYEEGSSLMDNKKDKLKDLINSTSPTTSSSSQDCRQRCPVCGLLPADRNVTCCTSIHICFSWDMLEEEDEETDSQEKQIKIVTVMIVVNDK
jgi:hypothetical protein